MKRSFTRKISLLTLAFLLLTLFPGGALADSIVAIDGDSAIRDQPQNTGNVIGMLPEGKHADYLDETSSDSAGNTWYYVFFQGVTGWISGRYSRLDSSSSARGGNAGGDFGSHYIDGYYYVDIIEYPDAERVVGKNGSSYIRSGPSTDAEDLGGLPQGATAIYLGLCCTDMNGREWYKIDFNGITGWVSARYAEIVTGGSSSSGDFGNHSIDGFYYVDIIEYPYAERVVAENGSTYIRSGPSTDGEDLGGMPQGATAIYLGLCCTDMNGREWYKINFNGTTGWVSARYTTLH